MTVHARQLGRWAREHFDAAAAAPRVPDARAGEREAGPESQPEPEKQITESAK